MRTILLLLLVSCLRAFPASWYVDNTASGAANGSSWVNAWTALSNVVWASVSAGDTVYISGGSTSKTYTETVFDGLDTTNIFRINKSGTAGNPVTITPGVDSGHTGIVFLNGNQDPRIRFGIQISGSYITIDGGANSNLCLINCTNLLDRNWGIGIYGGGTTTKVSRCIISNWNNGILIPDGLGHEISSNRLLRISGDVAIGDNSTAGVFGNVKIHHNYVECTVDAAHSGGADGIKPFNGSDTYENELRNLEDIGFANGQHPDSMQFTACGNFSRIYRNRIYVFANAAFEFGYAVTASNVFVADNVISFLYDTNLNYAGHQLVEGSFDGVLSNSFRNIAYVNNTFVDVGLHGLAWQKLSGLSESNHPPITNYIVANNIYCNAGLGLNAYLQIGSYPNTSFGDTSAEFILGWNVVYAGVAGFTNAIKNYGHATASEHAQVNTSYTDPQFVSYTPYSHTLNLHVQATSPAIGTGTNLTALYASYGMTSPVDFEGVARPAVGPWTIGAFETSASAPAGNAVASSALQGAAILRGRATLR